jgi:hypothetical protein
MNMSAILMRVALDHQECFMARNALDRRQIDPGLDQVGNGCMP